MSEYARSVTLLDANGRPAGTFSGNGGANTEVGLLTATAASPIVIQTAAAHGFQVNDIVRITGCSLLALNGTYKVTAVADGTHFAVTYDNTGGPTSFTAGKAISCMALSTASAVPGAANTQDKAVVVATFRNLAHWDELLLELKGSAVNTLNLTFDWMLQRPFDPDLTKWEDYDYFTQANNTAVDIVTNLPVPETEASAVQAAAGWAYADISASANGASVAAALTTLNVRPGFWGSALRLVIVPRAANMDGTHFLVAQVILRGVSAY